MTVTKKDLQAKIDSLESKVQLMNKGFVFDGIANALTRAGYSSYDKSVASFFTDPEIFDRNYLTSIYRGAGIGTRIIDIPSKDMVREWVKIEGDVEGEISQKLSDLKVKKYFKEAEIWRRLFGGSIILMQIDDGQDLDKPVNKDNIKSIDGLVVYDRHDIEINTTDIDEDIKSPNFGKPEIYTLINPTLKGALNRFPVHYSRILRFDGKIVPDFVRDTLNGWGDSVLTSIYTRLRGLCATYGNCEQIIQEFIIGVLKLKNLAGILSGKDGPEKLARRFNNLDKTKSTLNSLVIDTQEEYDRVSSSGVTGLRDLVEELKDALCGESGIPRVKLFGEQSKGIGGESSGSIRLYYDDIAQDQIDYFLDPLNILIEYINLSDEIQKPIETFNVEFNQLWQPTAKEEAETKKIIAETDEIYIGSTVLKPSTVTRNRFGGEEYSLDTILTDEEIREVESGAMDISGEEGTDE